MLIFWNFFNSSRVLQNVLLYSFYFPEETVEFLKKADILKIFVIDSIKLSLNFSNTLFTTKKS